MTREAVLARTMVELADNLVDDFDIVDLLTTLSDRCVEVLDVAAAGIMLAAPDGELRLMTSSSEAMRVVELFELQIAGRPVPRLLPQPANPSSTRTSTTADGRWPRFAAVAVDAGFRAADAIPMRLRGQVIGALNLFRTEHRLAERRRRRSPPKRSPTSPPSPSCSTATPSKPRPSTTSSTTRSPAASSSSRPRAWSPNANSSTCPTRSTDSAPSPAPTTAASTMSRARSSVAPSTSTIQPRRSPSHVLRPRS